MSCHHVSSTPLSSSHPSMCTHEYLVLSIIGPVGNLAVEVVNGRGNFANEETNGLPEVDLGIVAQSTEGEI